MIINIKTKDIELTRAIEDYIDKKIQTLKRFIPDYESGIAKASVEVGRTTRHHQAGDIFRAEINLSVGGKLFRVESARDDLYTAIDEVRDDLEREIKRFKEKKDTVYIRGARSFKKMFNLSPLARFRKKK